MYCFINCREDTQILKTGETEKTKNYSSLCYAAKELTEEDLSHVNSIENLVLQQKTPVRVLHRSVFKSEYFSKIQ